MEIYSKYYGRKNARALRSDDKNLYAELYPALQFNETGDVLEIGFGMGDFLVHQAMLHPELTFIGVEPFKTGLVSLLKKIKQNNILNIRIYHGVVHDIIAKLPLLSAIYILYPDPWPKKRHHKRRLIQKEFLLKLRQHLKPEGKIFIASDHADYQEWIEGVLRDTCATVCQPRENEDPCNSGNLIDPRFCEDDPLAISISNQPFENWISTKYEKRAKQEGRICQYYQINR